MSKIFVSIAAYRDPELVPTLKNMLETVSNPENLTVCIAWQHAEEDTWDNLDEFKEKSNFKILDIPYKEAKGVCYARNLIQQQLTNEAYYLQLDSHHRFTENWDKILTDYVHLLQVDGIKKPVLTGYLPGYHPKTDPDGRVQEVWHLNIDRFMPAGVPFLRPGHVHEWETFKKPFPSRFVSGHFIFTISDFVREVPYDPFLYFHGEETSLAGRAYTNGYDLFTPPRPLIWHEYTRQGKARHWDDSAEWSQQDRDSYARFRKIFDMDEVPCSPCQRKSLGIYGLGTVRSLEDFERYVGVKFRTRQIHQETLNNELPPIKSDFESGLANKHKVCIDLLKDITPEEDYEYLVVAILDKEGNDLYRQDLSKEQFYALKNLEPDNRFMHIWREYEHKTPPHMWRIWPYSTSKGWCDRIENNIGYE